MSQPTGERAFIMADKAEQCLRHFVWITALTDGHFCSDIHGPCKMCAFDKLMSEAHKNIVEGINLIGYGEKSSYYEYMKKLMEK